MHLVFASSNHHKLNEVRLILAPLGFDVIGLDAIPGPLAEPEETGSSFEENARIKATAYARAIIKPVLADDSGLEVDALHGAPGVHSAYYAGTGSTRAERDAANNAKLLRELRDVTMPRRTARFVCVMCLANSRGEILHETRGTFEGLITDQPAGENGFGYDPLLYLPDRQCTSAQLSPQEKNARSHRGEAARKMALWLREHAESVT